MPPVSALGIVLDLYGFIENMDVHVTQHPRQAVAIFTLNSERHSLVLGNPQCFEPLMKLLDACWCIQIIDRNIAEANQLNYGRYRLRIGGEDGPEVEVMLDSFEHSTGA